MKKFLPFSLLILLGLALSGCLEENCEETRLVRGFEPEIVTTDDWRGSAFGCVYGPFEPPCELTSFYVYGKYLLAAENLSGLYVFDNEDTSNPEIISFMDAPGIQGLAVRNNILYINQYTDLVAFDLSDPKTPRMVGRTEDVFDPFTVFAQVVPGTDNQFVVGWNETGDTRLLECNSENFNRGWFWGAENDRAFASDVAAFSANAASGSAGSPAPETVGQGGSLARFTIINGTLYAVDDQHLKAFTLADPHQPDYVQNVNIGWGIETIFPYEDKVFIGTQTGMQIFSIADPLNAEHLSTFEHVLSCDPVVVNDDKAYVTLWGGRDCGSTGDQLEIIDVSDPRNPESLQITPMSSSHGLGVAEGKLFLCSQWEGFRVFDLDGEGLLGDELAHEQDIVARDVIVLPQNNDLIVLGYGREGIQQYKYTDAGALTATSRIDLCD
ncbi:MAG: hypothetical protein AAFZ52_00430 [Bacteroidota bacterium]